MFVNSSDQSEINKESRKNKSVATDNEFEHDNVAEYEKQDSVSTVTLPKLDTTTSRHYPMASTNHQSILHKHNEHG